MAPIAAPIRSARTRSRRIRQSNLFHLASPDDACCTYEASCTLKREEKRFPSWNLRNSIICALILQDQRAPPFVYARQSCRRLDHLFRELVAGRAVDGLLHMCFNRPAAFIAYWRRTHREESSSIKVFHE